MKNHPGPCGYSQVCGSLISCYARTFPPKAHEAAWAAMSEVWEEVSDHVRGTIVQKLRSQSMVEASDGVASR